MRNARNNEALKGLETSQKQLETSPKQDRERLSQILRTEGLQKYSDMLSPSENSSNNESLRKSSVIAPMMYSPEGFEASQKAIRAITAEEEINQALKNSPVLGDAHQSETSPGESKKRFSLAHTTRTKTPGNPLRESVDYPQDREPLEPLSPSQLKTLESLRPAEKFKRVKEPHVNINYNKVLLENQNTVQCGIPIVRRFHRHLFNPEELLFTDILVTNYLRGECTIDYPISLTIGHKLEMLDVLDRCYPEFSGTEFNIENKRVTVTDTKFCDFLIIEDLVKEYCSGEITEIVDLFARLCRKIDNDAEFYELSSGLYNFKTVEELFDLVNMKKNLPQGQVPSDLLNELHVMNIYNLPVAPYLNEEYIFCSQEDCVSLLKKQEFARIRNGAIDIELLMKLGFSLFLHEYNILIYASETPELQFFAETANDNITVDSNVLIEKTDVQVGIEVSCLFRNSCDVTKDVIENILQGNFGITLLNASDWMSNNVILEVYKELQKINYFKVNKVECLVLENKVLTNWIIDFSSGYFRKFVEVYESPLASNEEQYITDHNVLQPIKEDLSNVSHVREVEMKFKPKQYKLHKIVLNDIEKPFSSDNLIQFGIPTLVREERKKFSVDEVDFLDQLVYSCLRLKEENNLVNYVETNLKLTEFNNVQILIEEEYPELFDTKLEFMEKLSKNQVLINKFHFDWLKLFYEQFIATNDLSIYSLFKFILSKCLNYKDNALLVDIDEGFYSNSTVREFFVFFLRKLNINFQIKYETYQNEELPIFELSEGIMKPLHTLIDFASYRSISPFFIPPIYCPDAHLPKCTMLSNSMENYVYLKTKQCHIYKSSLKSFKDLREEIHSVLEKFEKIHHVENLKAIIFEDNTVGLVGTPCIQEDDSLTLDFEVEVFKKEDFENLADNIDQNSIKELIAMNRLEIRLNALNDSFVIMSPGGKAFYNEDGLMGLNFVQEVFNFERLNRLYSHNELSYTVFVNLVIANERCWPKKVVEKFNEFEIESWSESMVLPSINVLICGETIENQILSAFEEIEMKNFNELIKAELLNKFLKRKLRVDAKINIGYSDSIRPLVINQFVLDGKIINMCFELNLKFTSVAEYQRLGINIPVVFFEEPNSDDIEEADDLSVFVAKSFLENEPKVTILDASGLVNILKKATVIINRLNRTDISLDLVEAQQLGYGVVLKFNEFHLLSENYEKHQEFSENILQFGIPKELRFREGFSAFSLNCVDEIIESVTRQEVLVQIKVDKFEMEEIEEVINVCYPELEAYSFYFCSFGIEVVPSNKCSEFLKSMEFLNDEIVRTSRNPLALFEYILSHCHHYSMDAHISDLLVNNTYSDNTLLSLLEIAFFKLNIASKIVYLQFRGKIQRCIVMKIMEKNYITLPIETLEEFSVYRNMCKHFIPGIYFALGMNSEFAQNSFEISTSDWIEVQDEHYTNALAKKLFFELEFSEENLEAILNLKSRIILQTNKCLFVGISDVPTETACFKEKNLLDFYADEGIKLQRNENSSRLEMIEAPLHNVRAEFSLQSVDFKEQLFSMSAPAAVGKNNRFNLLLENPEQSKIIDDINKEIVNEHLLLESFVFENDEISETKFLESRLPRFTVLTTQIPIQAIKDIYLFLVNEKLSSLDFMLSFLEILKDNNVLFQTRIQYAENGKPVVLVQIQTPLGQLLFNPNFPFVPIEALGFAPETYVRCCDFKAHAFEDSLLEVQYKLAYQFYKGLKHICFNAFDSDYFEQNISLIIGGALEIAKLSCTVSVESFDGVFLIKV